MRHASIVRAASIGLVLGAAVIACHPVHTIPLYDPSELSANPPQPPPRCVVLSFAHGLAKVETKQTPAPSVPLSTAYNLRIGESLVASGPRHLARHFTQGSACPMHLHIEGVEAELAPGTTIYDPHQASATIAAYVWTQGATKWSALTATGKGVSGMSSDKANEVLLDSLLIAGQSSEVEYERQSGLAWAKALHGALADLERQVEAYAVRSAPRPPPVEASPAVAGSPVAPPAVMASPSTPPPLPVSEQVESGGSEAGARTHDGFFLRFMGGGGLLPLKRATFSKSFDDSIHVVTLDRQPVGEFSFSLGGTIASGLVIAGEFGAVALTRSLAVEPALTSESTLDGGVNFLDMLTDYYPNPSGGLHFLASAGFWDLSVAESKNQSGKSSAASGPGFSLGSGYEFWISPEWSMGVLGRLSYAKLNGESQLNLFYPRLGATITYH